MLKLFKYLKVIALSLKCILSDNGEYDIINNC